MDFAAAGAVLDAEAAEARAEWRRLRGLVALAQRLIASNRHLDAVVELYAAVDLEIDLTGDCKGTAPLADALLELLELEDEPTHHAWMKSREHRS